MSDIEDMDVFALGSKVAEMIDRVANIDKFVPGSVASLDVTADGENEFEITVRVKPKARNTSDKEK